MNDEEPIVVQGRHIIVGEKCPHCNRWNKVPITVIKTKCFHCQKDFEKDISVEDKEKYNPETAKDFLWILMKRFKEENEIKYRANENNIKKIEILIDLLEFWGVEVTRKYVNVKNKNTGKMIYVSEFTFMKGEEFIYYIEEPLRKEKKKKGALPWQSRL